MRLTCEQLRKMIRTVPFTESTPEQRDALMNHAEKCQGCMDLLLGMAEGTLTPFERMIGCPELTPEQEAIVAADQARHAREGRIQ